MVLDSCGPLRHSVAAYFPRGSTTVADHAAARDEAISRDRDLLEAAQKRGPLATLAAFMKLSGPGWLQSAITLGGGSLAGSLYLGVIGGYDMLWLQPLMMILGVVMLSAIAYVTLSTGQKPFGAINRHINPVLGWGWIIAATMANLVWAMPQFSLGTAAIQQNLFPGVAALAGRSGEWLSAGLLFVLAAAVVWFYDSGSQGVKIFERILKGMVGVVVLSFFGVVAAMTVTGQLDWGRIAAGFLPDISLLWRPVADLQGFIDASGDPAYWTAEILNQQRQRMIAAAATAVGINMTFLLPYSMLRKGWDRTFRGLAAFDLSTGLFIPFLVTTSCVVIAAASQFHAQADTSVVDRPAAEATGQYRANLVARLAAGEARAAELPPAEFDARLDALPKADRQLAAMLVKRDAFDLAGSLENLFGSGGLTQKVFGIGVLGMAISTIIILMLINGFCVTEMLGAAPSGSLHRIGSLLPGITGSLGYLYLWSNADAKFWLAVPTSNFGMVLLPIAYVTFFLMMNSRSLLGDAMPTGGRRLAFNLAMLVAITAATVGAALSIWTNIGWWGVAAASGFILLAAVVSLLLPRRAGA